MRSDRKKERTRESGKEGGREKELLWLVITIFPK